MISTLFRTYISTVLLQGREDPGRTEVTLRRVSAPMSVMSMSMSMSIPVSSVDVGGLEKERRVAATDVDPITPKLDVQSNMPKASETKAKAKIKTKGSKSVKTDTIDATSGSDSDTGSGSDSEYIATIFACSS